GPQFKHKPVHFRRTPDDRVRQLLQFFATKKRQKAKDRPNQKLPWRPVTPPAKCRAILVETKHAYRGEKRTSKQQRPRLCHFETPIPSNIVAMFSSTTT
ncbi:hypothetical protein, partial [Salmonella sp. s58408]|uniref:hypothetical protein n=1 Tax=Salmonella sp. s58408 TaxID=3159701 RepID=UPI0039801ED6